MAKKILALLLTLVMLINFGSVALAADSTSNFSIDPAIVNNRKVNEGWVTIYTEFDYAGNESLVLKLYSDDELLGTSTLVDTEKVLLNGEQQYGTTGHIFYTGSDDWWKTEWIVSPVANKVPDRVELWVDGTCRAENTVFMNNSNDNLGAANITYNYGDLDGVAVAKIGENGYNTLQDAINAASAESNTITLLGDTNATGITVAADDNVVIDLGGNTVNGDFMVYGKATIKNGTVINTSFVSGIESNGASADLTVEKLTVTSNRHAIRVDGGKAHIISGTYTSTTDGSSCYAVNVGGDIATAITIDGGEFISSAKASTQGTSLMLKNSLVTSTINSGVFNTAETHCVENYGTMTINGGSFKGSIVANETTVIYGGEFDKDPSAYLAEGYKLVNNENGTYGVEKTHEYVAEINGSQFETLQAAIDAAGEENTVKLLGDITVNAVDSQPSTHAWVQSGKNVIIDLNGYTVTGAFYINGTATIQNGTIINNDCVSGIETEGKLTLENMTITSNRHAVRVSGGEVIINSGKYTTTADSSTSGYALNIKSSSGAVVTVNGGEFYGSAGGGVTGKSAVTVQKDVDKIIINGGKFYSGAAAGTAYSVENYSSLSEIKGGEFNGSLVNAYKNVTGGKFSADPSAQIAAGKTVKSGADNYYEVIDAVAQIGDNCYATIEAAIEAAADGDTVQLFAGTYVLPMSNSAASMVNKEITFAGIKETIIDYTSMQIGYVDNMAGAKLTFDGVTVKWSDNNEGYQGIKNAAEVVYNNCDIYGTQFMYDCDARFISCALYSTKGYCVWTYTAKSVIFIDCVFNTGGRAVLVYTEGEHHADITVKNCDFNSDSTDKTDKAAVEVGSSPYSADTTYTITFLGENTAEKFCANHTSNPLLGNKNDMANTNLTGVINPETNEAGEYIGGTFIIEPAEEVLADGYVPVANADGSYSVAEKSKVNITTGMLVVRDYKHPDLNNNGVWGAAEPYRMLIAVGIDSLNYSKTCGFDVTINGTTQRFIIENATVWDSFTYTDNTNGSTTILPTTLGEGNNYIMYYIITFDRSMVEANPQMTVNAFVTCIGDTDVTYICERTFSVA